jgi:MFS family permease
MVAFLSVYLLFLGLPETRVSWLTSGVMLGAILFQVPVAWLADHLGRTLILVSCYLAAAAGLAWLPYCSATAWLAFWLFLVGACSGAFYPLGLALLGERLPAHALAGASAWYLGINCCGSLIGPAVTGVAMDLFGKRAVFAAGEVIVGAVLLTWLGLRARAAVRSRGTGARARAGEVDLRQAA